jgi:hypothetical protein
MATAKSELSELKRMGAVPQKNSGRGKHDKGDGVLDDFWLVDIKEYAVGFMVSLSSWAKVCTDAFKAGSKEPLLKLVLGTGNKKVRVVVISESMFELMYESYRESVV